MKHLKNYLKAMILGSIIFILFNQCTNSDAESYRFFPSKYKAYNPQDNLVTFKSYINENRYRIKKSLEPLYFQGRPFGNNLTLEDVVQLRSPEQHLPDENCIEKKNNKKGYRVGFLFLHGVTDSPYSLKEVQESIRDNFPCAVYRSTVMPGHATIPGDASEVTYHEWKKMLDYALYQFLGEIDQIYLIGFSTGFTLAMEHLQSQGELVSFRKEKYLIKAIIGLSPALRASPLVFLTPYIKKVTTFLDVYLDEDPVKYESFNLNLASEFYQLSQEIDLEKEINFPIFMAVSSDDQTVNPVVNYDFYCKLIKSKSKKMIWYQGIENIFTPCDGMEVVEAKNKKYSMINMSHVAIPFSKNNLVYGYKKDYVNCLSYYGENLNFLECKNNDNSYLYGEDNLLKDKILLEGKFYRRGTFNPDFKNLMNKMIDFISIHIEI